MFKNVTDNRTYNILKKRRMLTRCFICAKRSGCYYFAPCDGLKFHGVHGSGKQIFSTNYRAFKTWKHNRKKQYKENENSNYHKKV